LSHEGIASEIRTSSVTCKAKGAAQPALFQRIAQAARFAWIVVLADDKANWNSFGAPLHWIPFAHVCGADITDGTSVPATIYYDEPLGRIGPISQTKPGKARIIFQSLVPFVEFLGISRKSFPCKCSLQSA
jgi:hypothetical protein